MCFFLRIYAFLTTAKVLLFYELSKFLKKNLKNVFYTEQHKKCVQEMQALIVKYTNSYESRIVGILENCGTTYTKLQGLANPEDLKTRII